MERQTPVCNLRHRFHIERLWASCTSNATVKAEATLSRLCAQCTAEMTIDVKLEANSVTE